MLIPQNIFNEFEDFLEEFHECQTEKKTNVNLHKYLIFICKINAINYSHHTYDNRLPYSTINIKTAFFVSELSSLIKLAV